MFAPYAPSSSLPLHNPRSIIPPKGIRVDLNYFFETQINE